MMTELLKIGKIQMLAMAPFLLLLVWSQTVLGANEAIGRSSEERMKRGETMYRDGLLPGGAPIKAFASGDVPVDGTVVTCVSCHLRSGLGSIEGEAVTPPANGRVLYQPRKSYIPGSEFVPSVSNYAKHLPERPAYTDATLSSLIRAGVDATGRSVLHVMPRYELDEENMAILIEYLKTLSDKPSPGVTPENIKFATVITEGASPAAIESMLAPLQFSVDRKNSLAQASRKNFRVARMGYNMLGDLSNRTFSLARWTLRGHPDTWRAQLDEYYRKEPVFALLGGISDSEWEPVHRFCEDNRIPNLFPVVDYPVLSDTDWYTLYFSRGIRQEGEAAARYLHGRAERFNSHPVVQISRDTRRGKALAAGFRETWQNAGHPPPHETRLQEGELLTGERLREIVAQHKPAALLLWDSEQSLDALAAIAGKNDSPGIIMASGTYMGKGLFTVPEQLRDLVYFTYPYRLPQDDVRFDTAVKKVIPGKPLDSYDQHIIRQSYITAEVLGKALMEMRGEYHRDFLFDTIGMMAEMYFPLFERVSFGPGQRYASKGCYIVQLGKGLSARLERRSDWSLP